MELDCHVRTGFLRDFFEMQPLKDSVAFRGFCPDYEVIPHFDKTGKYMAAFIPTVADKDSVFRLIGQVILVCE